MSIIYICLKNRVNIDISIMVICYTSAIIDDGRRTPELSNAPLHMKQDNDSIDKAHPKP